MISTIRLTFTLVIETATSLTRVFIYIEMEIISKAEAKEKGLKFYFNGKPCKNGHIASRMMTNTGIGGGCLECRPSKVKFDVRSGLYDNHIAIYHQDLEYKDRRLQFDFDNLTPENCYILGLLWADGGTYINGNSIRISIQNVLEDMQDLENIFDKIGLWNKVPAKKGIGSDGVFRRDQIKFQTNDRIFGQTLLNFGFKDKSIIPPDKLLEIIPKDLKFYFYRGYFDGDGCFYVAKKNRSANVVGHYDYDFTFFIDLLNELNIKYSQVKRSDIRKNGKINSLNRVSFSGVNNILKFGDYIYQDQIEIGLKRKYDKYLMLLDYSKTKKR